MTPGRDRPGTRPPVTPTASHSGEHLPGGQLLVALGELAKNLIRRVPPAPA